jgi:hypothetical protein
METAFAVPSFRDRDFTGVIFEKRLFEALEGVKCGTYLTSCFSQVNPVFL